MLALYVMMAFSSIVHLLLVFITCCLGLFTEPSTVARSLFFPRQNTLHCDRERLPLQYAFVQNLILCAVSGRTHTQVRIMYKPGGKKKAKNKFFSSESRSSILHTSAGMSFSQLSAGFHRSRKTTKREWGEAMREQAMCVSRGSLRYCALAIQPIKI